MTKITPNLWFSDNAEEAAKFYTSIFKNSSIGAISRYGDAGSSVSGQKKGSVMTIQFTLDGQELIGLNGGPIFKLSEAVSFVVDCKDQAEVDHYWSKLSEGGEEGPCGWLKDKFGLSWQVVPSVLREMMADKDPARTDAVMEAILKMHKIDIKELEKAYGKSLAKADR